MQSAPSTSTAKHLRACENCSRAKAKCIPQDDSLSSQCARCFRLKKECKSLPRAQRKRRNSAQLEQKIESLVTLLSAAQGAAAKSESQGALEPPQDRPHVNILRDFPWENNANAQDESSQESGPSASNISRASINCTLRATGPTFITGTNFMSDINSQSSEPESLFRVFREQFAIHCPYTIIPPGVSAQDFSESQPWLYKTILMIASFGDRNRQLEMGKKIGQEISEAMLLRGEKSLDMLQCLLVYNSWSYYFSSISPQVHSSGMLQLTIALLFDLGLNRAGREDEGGPHDVLEESSKRGWVEASRKAWSASYNPREKKCTNAERRALLYLFYLTSITALCAKKIDGLQNSPFIEYSCQNLLEEAEYESDLVLVACVRLQFIIESTNRNLATRPTSSDGLKAPIWMHTTAVKRELQSILVSLPSHLQNHLLFRMSYHSAEIFLYEPSLQKSLFPGGFSSQRLDMLYSALVSTKSLLDLFVSQPLVSYFGFCIPNTAQIGHALSTLFKLSVINEVGWDLQHIRRTVNLPAYFDQLISKFEEAGAQIDNMQTSPCRESFPTACAKAMARVKCWYEQKVALESESNLQTQPSMSGLDDLFAVNSFDYLDDAYWQELMDMNFISH